jgi:hypothetical protein
MIGLDGEVDVPVAEVLVGDRIVVARASAFLWTARCLKARRRWTSPC